MTKVTFMQTLQPLLPVLCETWNFQRYSSMGNAPKDDLDGNSLTKILRSGFFHTYLNMCVVIETLPTRISAFSEACPCHQAVLPKLSDQQRESMMGRHYHTSMQACPLQGMMVPELVGGQIDQYIASVSNTSLAEVLAYPKNIECNKVEAPAQDEIQDVVDDWNKGNAALLAILRLKVDFLKRLPCLLAGLALINEESARKIGREVLAQFAQCPVQDQHHRLTWKLLQEDAPFRRELQTFVDGKPRRELAAHALETIASFRYLFSAESRVEGKHGKVTVAAAYKRFLPTRVSLQNRLPLLEKWLASGQVSGDEFVESFAQVRSHRRAASKFGIQDHPSRGKGERSWRKVLEHAIYNTHLDGMFRSLAGAQAQHTAAANAERLQFARDKIRRSGSLRYKDVIHWAMFQHIANTIDEGIICACPKYAARIVSLQDVLAEPAAKRQRVASPGEGLFNQPAEAPDLPSASSRKGPKTTPGLELQRLFPLSPFPIPSHSS